MGRSPNLPFRNIRERRRERNDYYAAGHGDDRQKDESRYGNRTEHEGDLVRKGRVEQRGYYDKSRNFKDSSYQENKSRQGHGSLLEGTPSSREYRKWEKEHVSRDRHDSRDRRDPNSQQEYRGRDRQDFNFREKKEIRSLRKEEHSTPRRVEASRKVQFDLKAPEAPRKVREKMSSETPKKKNDKTEGLDEQKNEQESNEDGLEKLKMELREKEKEMSALKKRATTKTRTLEILADTHKKNNVLLEKIDTLEEEFKLEKEGLKIMIEEARKVACEPSESEHNLKQEIGNLEKDVACLERERDKLRKDLKKKDNVIIGYEVEVDALGKKLDEKDEWILEIEKKLEAKQHYIMEIETKLTGFGKSLEVMNHDVEDREDEMDNEERSGGDDTESDSNGEDGDGDDESDEVVDDDEEKSAENEEVEVAVKNGVEKNEEQKVIESPDMFQSEEVVESQNLLNSVDVFLPSDEEFAEEQIRVGRTIVSNYSKERESLSSDVKVPHHLFKKGDKFKSTTVSLNNKLVFMATCMHEIPHGGERRICRLSPACNIFWEKGDPIAKVKVLAWEGAEVPPQEIWSCAHHARASAQGFGLQTQRYDGHGLKKLLEKNEEELDQDVGRVEGSDSENDMGPSTQKLLEKIDEGLKLIKNDDEYVVKNKGDGKRVHFSRSEQNNKNKKKKRFGVEEVKKAIQDYEEEGGDASKK